MATPNMGLVLPVPGVTQAIGVAPSGQSWLELLNSALEKIDSHNHATGSGAPVSGSGFAITSDLDFGGYNAIGLRSARFASQGSPIGLASDINCIYVSGGNLYFNDGSGNKIQLTAAGLPAGGGGGGGSGGIPGLVSPASLIYSGGTFIFSSSTGVGAYLSSGPISIRQPLNGGYGVTLAANGASTTNYQMTMPSALPAGQRIMTLDASGNVAAAWNVDGTTIQVAANSIGLVALGVGTGYIANLAVTTAKIADANVTKAKLAALGQQASAASGSFSTTSTSTVDVTNLSVTITTTGRPVMLMAMANDASSGAAIACNNTGNLLAGGLFYWDRGGANIAQMWLQGGYNSGSGPTDPSVVAPPGSVNFIDTPAAGTYTYKLRCRAFVTGSTVSCVNVKIVAFEL